MARCPARPEGEKPISEHGMAEGDVMRILGWALNVQERSQDGPFKG
jgi:hypothetical protein